MITLILPLVLVLSLNSLCLPTQPSYQPLTRQRLVTLLKGPCQNIVTPEGVSCYKVGDGIVAFVRFDDDDRVRRLAFYSGCRRSIKGLDAIASKILPDSYRGRHVARTDKGGTYRCVTSYTNDYEYLTASYSQSNCTSCRHASISFTWKRRQ